MRLLLAGLERHGLRIIARSPARHDWARDTAFVAQLAACDLIVINGEGTLHHARKAGARLLAVIDHPARGRTPVAIVNALWQENPPNWAAALKDVALISARDGRSAAEIAAAVGEDRVRVVPDLSLSMGAEPQAGPRDALIFGDSVRLSARQALAMAARRVGADRIVPTKTLPGAAWRLPLIRGLLSALYCATRPFSTPPLILAATERDYLAQLGRARMHVTGRFHAICLSLVTGTPFLAVTSNSWKVEALLADAGLAPDRSIPMDQMARMSRADMDRPFTPGETEAIRRFLDRAREQAETLFSDLAELARSGGRR